MNDNIKDSIEQFRSMTADEMEQVLTVANLIRKYGEPFSAELRTAMDSGNDEQIDSVIAKWKKGF